MAEKLRVGLIGCGRFAEPGHAVYYRLNPRADFRAVCDMREDAARKLAGKYGVPNVFTDAEEMMDSGLDAVSICTPTFTHAPLLEAAAARGIHVMCEKPFSISVEEADSMIAACAGAGVKLHVGYHMRCDRGISRVRDFIRGGEYGDCFHADIRWHGLSTMGNVPMVNRGLEIARMLGMSLEGFSPEWRLHDPRIPGGILEVFCHILDIALWIFGEPDGVEGDARIISGESEKPEHATVMLHYSDGPSVFLNMSSRTLSLREKQQGRFNCTGGNIIYETSSVRQTALPARVTVETDNGLLGSRRTLAPAFDARPARNLPHYRKIDNFLLDAMGELPPEEEKHVARGEDARAVDGIIQSIIKK